jgi:hypothetical protein
LTAITLGRVWGSHTQSGVLTCESVRVLIASNAVGDSGGSRGDVFTADKAWWFITLLTIGYLVNRGLAQSWQPDPDCTSTGK